MSASSLNFQSDVQLLEAIVEAAIGQHDAQLDFDTVRYNRLYRHITAIVEELKGRTGDDRWLLTSLYHHPHPQVRLVAAIHTLAIDPQSAIAVMQDIIDRAERVQTPHAREMIDAYADGRYLPQ